MFKYCESVEPKGWLKDFLRTQADGLTGNIYQAGYPFNKVEWGVDNGPMNYLTGDIDKFIAPEWWAYEQTAYWCDGYTRTAILLKDEKMLAEAQRMIYNVINHPDADGYIGPSVIKEQRTNNRWPFVVFFRACIALYELNKDKKITEAIKRHYLESKYDYGNSRDFLNIEIILWLYEQTNDNTLLDMAERIYGEYEEKNKTEGLSEGFALSDKKPLEHGVSYNEYSKIGAYLYRFTGKDKYLKSSENAYAKIDKWFALPGGCHSSAEFLLSNHVRDSYETCDISDYTWALSYLYSATENGAYGDKIEKCIFNSGIGSVLEDFRGLQYFSCANQVLADRQSNHNPFYQGLDWMQYKPNPGTECCPGNVNRFMPNYVMHMWATDGESLIATLFGPSEVFCNLLNNNVQIEEKTDYPFRDSVIFKVKADREFSLRIRIPEWSKYYIVNGVKREKSDSFIKLTAKDADEIKIEFLPEIIRKRKDGAMYFERGAVVYSLGCFGKRVIDKQEKRSSEEYPAYEMYYDEKWNYGISKNSELIYCEGNSTKWDLRFDLPYLKTTGVEITNYKCKVKERIRRYTNMKLKKYRVLKLHRVLTPDIIKKANQELGETAEIRLYPYGACKMRMTALPIID